MEKTKKQKRKKTTFIELITNKKNYKFQMECVMKQMFYDDDQYDIRQEKLLFIFINLMISKYYDKL